MSKIYEWNLMFYTFTDNDLEVGSFRDLAKLTSNNYTYSNVIIHMLLDTATMGSYLIQITGNPYQSGNISMKRLPPVDMSKSSTLQHFIEHSIQSGPSHRKALILGGHGSGWLLLTEEDSAISAAKLGHIFRSTPVKLDLLCFDNCLMSTLETMNELHDCVDYVIAYQDYAGWDGIIETSMIKHFDDVKISTLELARELVQSLLIKINERVNDALKSDRTNPPDPTDVSIISISQVSELVQYIKSLGRLKQPTNTDFCVDPNYWHLQDLTSIVQSSVPLEKYYQYLEYFKTVVVVYQQSINKHNRYHYGLSCIVDPEKDTFDTWKLWKELSLRLLFQ